MDGGGGSETTAVSAAGAYQVSLTPPTAVLPQGCVASSHFRAYTAVQHIKRMPSTYIAPLPSPYNF